MARPAEFNFVQEKHLTDTRRMSKLAKHTVTINAKHGYMRFSLSYVKDKGLENAFIKLYADTSKKAIGWKIMRETDLSGLAGYRQLKVFKKKTPEGYESQHCQLGVQKLLEVLGVKKEKTFKQLPIESYQLGPMDGSINYVSLQ